MVKDHSDSDEETYYRHMGYFPISNKSSFTWTVPQTG